MTYSEKLKDPRWQRRRLQLFEAANWTCEKCVSKTKTLHAHHGCYRRNTDPWDYPDWVMHVLCDGCHEEVQAWLESTHEYVGMLSYSNLLMLHLMLSSIANATNPESKSAALFALALVAIRAKNMNAWPTNATAGDGSWASKVAIYDLSMDAEEVPAEPTIPVPDSDQGPF